MATEERETVSLIGSDKVEGTAVYGADETQIGSIERVMIDKRSGKVSYAVLSFGGFLGIGDDHYPLPWESLKYDTRPWRLPDRHHRKAAPGCAKIQQRQRLELGRSDPYARRERLLRGHPYLSLNSDRKSPLIKAGFFCLREPRKSRWQPTSGDPGNK